MSNEITLYDVDDELSHPESPTEFRSIQVFRCSVCLALTNRIFNSCPPFVGYHLILICPNRKQKWHRELMAKVNWLNHPHPEDYRKALGQEINAFRKKHKAEIQNDLVGNPNFRKTSHCLRKNFTHSSELDFNNGEEW